jgi:hypothetical protein
MARMAALQRGRPDDAARAAASVLRGDLGEATAKRVIGALGGAGTEQAQHALSSLVEATPASSDPQRRCSAGPPSTTPPPEVPRAAKGAAASM